MDEDLEKRAIEAMPVVSSLRFHAADAKNKAGYRVNLREVLPLQLEAAARGTRCTCGAALKQIHGMGTRRNVLSVDNDNEFRSRCE
jgi:hypothetical protein